MPKLKIPQGEWIVVCDGSKALVLENVGDAQFPHLRTRQVFDEKHPRTSELGTDAPGRAFSSVGPGRSAMEQTDWQEQEERRFLGELLSHLDAEVSAGRLNSLVIVAPPRALGFVRQSYTHQVRGVLREEIDKDLVNKPVHEIERYFTA